MHGAANRNTSVGDTGADVSRKSFRTGRERSRYLTFGSNTVPVTTPITCAPGHSGLALGHKRCDSLPGITERRRLCSDTTGASRRSAALYESNVISSDTRVLACGNEVEHAS